MPQYQISLLGDYRADLGIPGPVVRDLVGAIDRSARGAVRMQLEGRSTATGPQPAWVTKAAEFAVVEVLHKGGSAGLVLQAASLAESIPDRFSQTDLFPPPIDPSKSALTLMVESLSDALEGRSHSDAYDDSLLRVFEDFAGVLRGGIQAVSINNGRPDAIPVEINPKGLQTIERLKDATPPPMRARLAGTLDTIRYSNRAFTLAMRDGTRLRGVLTDTEPEFLATLFGKVSVVAGVAHFRPDSTILRIDAEKLIPGTSDDLDVWSNVPRPMMMPIESRELRRPQGPRSGVNALLGKWSGFGSDQEILAALEALG